MRYAIMLAMLAFLAAVPLRAQQEGEQQKAAAPTTHEMTAEDQLDAQLATDWTKLDSHWSMIESMSGKEKEEQLETQRSMLDDYMKKVDQHAKLEAADEAGGAEAKEMQASLKKLDDHWKMVKGIEDPAKLETHLGMHMDMLRDLYGKGQDEGMHEGMEHGDMDHGKMEGAGNEEGAGDSSAEPRGESQQTKPEEEKPAGY